MKLTKKVLALSLSLAMASAMGVTTYASDVSTAATYSITINNAMGKYKAYQVFEGDLTTNVLSNVRWGDGVTPFEYGGTDDAAEIAKKLEGEDNDSDAVKSFASLAASRVNDNCTEVTASGGAAQITNLAPGYYVILNSDVADGEAISRYILQVTKNQTINNKAAKPEFEKKIKDINDTTDIEYSDWQDSADYDIGDKIPFQLKGTVASDYSEYDEYYFAFHDVEEKGLTFDESTVEVSVDGAKIASNLYKLKTSNTDKCTFEVVFADLKTIGSVHAGSVITVDYKSTLNSNAVLGEKGNVNKAKLEYSNNPNDSQGGKGSTPWDNVIVFTYKVVINKVDGDNNNAPLSGAEFTLSKKLKDGSTKDIAVVKNTAGTKFTFSGLDDGDYVLTETTTPSGYNTIAPITFKVTAAHDIVWTTQKRDDVLTSLSGNKVEGEITLVADKKEGSLTSDVVNKSGSTLPSTGGIGTTIFYVVGVILMLGAGVLLVTKKRMSANR